MTYYRVPFGNGVLTSSGGNVVENVHNQFGPRDVGDTVGVNRVDGIKEELIIDLTPDLINGVPGPFRPFVLPRGAVITAVYINVEEAFALSGTTPAVEVGTAGSEATNGFTLSEATLEAVGASNQTANLSGTWDSEAALAADTTIGFAKSGTSPVVNANVGKARITILFDRTVRKPSPAKKP